jgi:hypothetical protein
MAGPALASALALGFAWLLGAGCGGDDSGSGAASSGSANGGAGGSGGSGFGGGAGGGPSYGCSADLRSVVDANGSIVETCPPDQGCLDGQCVEACAAAAGSHGNLGCDFRVTTAGSYPPALPPCFAVFVANAWPREAQLTVTRAGESFDVTQFGRIPVNGQPEASWPAVPASGIPVDGVAVLFLSHDPASILPETGAPLSCPVPPASNTSTVYPGTGTGDAFYVQSNTPISVYDMLPYGGAPSHFPSAALVYPTSAWGTNYVMIATPPGTYSSPGPLWAHVLASEDDTTVQILPTVGLPAGPTFPAAPANQTATFTVSAGQYLQWELPGGSPDPSGTVVLSDKPVAVLTGNRFYRFQPQPQPGGESTHQQNLPVSALGNDYAAAPYETRRADLAPEAIHYRMVGAFDGTALTFDPPIGGAPATLARGEVVDLVTDQAFQVRSQDADHPFAMAQIMNSAYFIGVGQLRPGAVAPGFDQMLGDEEFVVMLPPAQFLQRYVFFTDPSYPTTNLVLTRVRTSTGFKDVTVDCVGVVSGWKPVGSGGVYEVTTVDLIRADIPVGSCDNGRHTAESQGPFGIVVWGLDSYSSYAYPAGGNAAQLTDAVVQPIPE